MYIKALLYIAGATAVLASLWMMVVQPRLDLAAHKEEQSRVEIAELHARLAHKARLIEDYIEENKRRQEIASKLQDVTQRIDRSLDITLSNIRRYSRETNDPNLLACLDMPVADFHARVRASDEAATGN